MSTKTINTRIQMKHDSAEKWSTSTFVPFEGEIIFYSDLNKIKIGDGSKNVNELPFITIDKTDIIEFINHNHDGQYYTEKEVDSLISALETLLATKYDNSSVLPASQIEGSFGIALVPNTTNVYSLGTSEKNWKNIYLSGDLIFGTDVKINSAGITLKNNTVLTDGTNSTTVNDIVNHNHNQLYYQKSEVDSKIIEAKHTITANASDDDVVILTGTNGQNAVSYTASHSKTNKAGTYTKVTVNDYGHVTSGENPTTLSDYGITDVYTKSQTDSELAKKLPNDTLYAGSSSTGGSATSAVKLDTTTAGSTTQPVYFSEGKPIATTYSLAKSVPANAVFTDTTYENATTSKAGLMSTTDKTNLDKLITAWIADGNDDQLINKVEEVVKAFENAPEGTNIVTALAGKADKSSLATVATSGSYTDLSNKPTIPTVNNATLTLNVGGQTVSGNNTFTANDTTNTTYNVPSATDSAYGVVKVSSVNSSAVTVNSESTTAGRYYSVELNSDGKAIVNVPWTDTNTDTDTHYTKYLQIKGNGTEAIKYTQDSDKSLNLKPGTNVTISAASGEITINATDTTYSAATDSAAGLMSAADKKKLDGIAAGAQANVADTDATVKLSADIWTDKTIGYINGTSSSPKKVASAGDTLKTMFTNIFGTVTDDTSNLVTNPYFSSVSIGNSSYEYGTKLNSVSVTVTPVAGSYKYGPSSTGSSWSGNYTLSGTGFTTKNDSTANTQTVSLSSQFTVGSSSTLTLKASRAYTAGTTTAQSKMGATTTQKITAGTAEKSGTFNPTAVKYVYWAKSTSTSTPTTWTKYGSGQTSVTDLQLSCAAGEYIWVATTTNATSFYAWNDASGKYNTDKLPTTKANTTTSITNSQGASAPGYYIYRTTDKMLQAVNTKFKLA